jgi:hypothetical protein
VDQADGSHPLRGPATSGRLTGTQRARRSPPGQPVELSLKIV